MNHIKPRKILIIDDNKDIHDDFKKILCPTSLETQELEEFENKIFDTVTTKITQTLSYSIHSAYQGHEGVVQVQKSIQDKDPFLMAFVDMRMPPGWDGAETIRHLWKVDENLQVVICTAYSDYSWEEIQDMFGCSDSLLILKKPFDPSEVNQIALALTEKRILKNLIQEKMESLEENMIQEQEERLKIENDFAEYLNLFTSNSSTSSPIQKIIPTLSTAVEKLEKFSSNAKYLKEKPLEEWLSFMSELKINLEHTIQFLQKIIHFHNKNTPQ